MNGGHRVFGEYTWGSPDNCEVAGEVSGHVVPRAEGLHVDATDHARGEGPRGVEEQLVDERGLPA